MSSDDAHHDLPKVADTEAADPAPVNETLADAAMHGIQGPPADAAIVPAVVTPAATDPAEVAVTTAWVEVMAMRMEELQQQFERLQQTFDEKIRYDAGREAVIDRLHAELQEYKTDLVFKILRPLCLDLINLHDEVGKLIAAHQGAARSEEGAELLRLYATFQAGIEAILAGHGVDSFTIPEPQFDGKRQRAVSTVPTDDPQRDRTIAERSRPGFMYESRILRPEVVTVFVYQPPAQS